MGDIYQNRKAFTMLELTFVIVIIGILSAIAIPKFAATRDDALVTKGKTTLASVRNAISAERQQRILRGDFATPINDLSNGDPARVFTAFNNDAQNNANLVLEYSLPNCTNAGCWSGSGTTYLFYLPVPPGATCTYTLANNRLDLTAASGVSMPLCRQLLEE